MHIITRHVFLSQSCLFCNPYIPSVFQYCVIIFTHVEDCQHCSYIHPLSKGITESPFLILGIPVCSLPVPYCLLVPRTQRRSSRDSSDSRGFPVYHTQHWNPTGLPIPQGTPTLSHTALESHCPSPPGLQMSPRDSQCPTHSTTVLPIPKSPGLQRSPRDSQCPLHSTGISLSFPSPSRRDFRGVPGIPSVPHTALESHLPSHPQVPGTPKEFPTQHWNPTVLPIPQSSRLQSSPSVPHRALESHSPSHPQVPGIPSVPQSTRIPLSPVPGTSWGVPVFS